jgi:hypothetical protein
MDTLSNAVFGMKIDMQNNQKSQYFDHFIAFITAAANWNPFIRFNSIFSPI